MIWKTARGTLELETCGIIMGILNVTPDSFSDGGKFTEADGAIRHALGMIEDGATIVDIGGESTRPGAQSVPAKEERRRVIPVVEELLARSPDSLVSVDTSKSEVALAALEAGAAIINDVTGLRGDPEIARVTARAGAGLVLMHMQGSPLTMQRNPVYGNVVEEVRASLAESMEAAHSAGNTKNSIALDPGIGFGKNLEHNLDLLRHLGGLQIEERPIVVGISRKSFLTKITNASTVEERLSPTLALTALLRARGARVFRVHDVRANVAALKAAEAVLCTT